MAPSLTLTRTRDVVGRSSHTSMGRTQGGLLQCTDSIQCSPSRPIAMLYLSKVFLSQPLYAASDRQICSFFNLVRR